MAWVDIKGQTEAINFLVNAARIKRLAHSFIFLGPEGIGKKLVAKEFAKFLFCENPSQQGACGHCLNCIKCNANNHPDLHIISFKQLDKIKIETIRDLQRQMYFSPFSAKSKICIIDNAHMLTIEAANSLLKLMEEPPKETILILITEREDSCLETLISRCQRLYFSPLSTDEIKQSLKEICDDEEELINFVARFSQGRLGRAIWLLESRSLLKDKDSLFDNLVHNNLEMNSFAMDLDRDKIERQIEFMLFFLRDMLLLKVGARKDLLINSDKIDKLSILSERFSISDIQGSLDDALKAQELNRSNVNPKILLSWLSGQIEQKLRA